MQDRHAFKRALVPLSDGAVCRYLLCNGTIIVMQKPHIAFVIQFAAAAVLLAGVAAAQTSASSQTSQSAGTPAKTPTGTTVKKAPATAGAAGPVVLTTQKDKESYALGMNIGASLKRQGVAASVDSAILARGLRDAISGGKTILPMRQCRRGRPGCWRRGISLAFS